MPSGSWKQVSVMRNDDVGAAASRQERLRGSPGRAGRQVLAYGLGMTAATAFGLGSILLIEALTYPANGMLNNFAGMPPAFLLLLLLFILLTVLSANLLPFLLVRWVMVRLLPRVGWVASGATGGLASLAGLLSLDYSLYDLAIAEPPRGGIIYAMAVACGAVSGLVYRALGGFPKEG